jgi:hypothetical protein
MSSIGCKTHSIRTALGSREERFTALSEELSTAICITLLPKKSVLLK